MEVPPVNSMVFRFLPGADPRMILALAQVIDLYHSTVLEFFFALRGAHDNGGAAKVEELETLIKEWVCRQSRIMEVGEP